MRNWSATGDAADVYSPEGMRRDGNRLAPTHCIMPSLYPAYVRASVPRSARGSDAGSYKVVIAVVYDRTS